MSVNLDDDIGEINLQDMNLLFYYEIKSLKPTNLFKNITFDQKDFSKFANFLSFNQFYKKNDVFLFPVGA